MASESCVCGRLKARAASCVSHAGAVRRTYFRCECGLEWTRLEADIDPGDPVSADEVIQVHQLLERDEAEPWLALFRS